MRLLNTNSRRLQEFFDKDIPPYAILSHRWGEDEVLYQDMIQTADYDKTRKKRGFDKLEGSCGLAGRQDYEWIWIDTCCIDKSSSAELTEAINSMYRWYEGAKICYAYLDDVEDLENMTESKWFTRGWTLQELVAPDTVEFYSASWKCLGTKRSLVRPIAAKSQVDVQVLMGGDPLEMSVARRMYWASHRVTTRVEDEAYCLLGLFGVNMPLIYGEGRKAFRRLQEEIIRSNNDQSILAWYATEEKTGTAVDFLASRASDFQESGNIAAHPYSRTDQEAMMITSQGLSLELVVLSSSHDVSSTTESGQLFGEVDAILDCQIGGIPGTFASIKLRRQSKGGGPGRRQNYYRIISSGFQSRFSVHRGQFESCDPRTLRDDATLVTGIDPTQLDKDVYKETLDRSSDYTPWRQEQIIISRPPRSASGKRLTSGVSRDPGNPSPWSLLLASSQEADHRSFWFVLYFEPHSWRLPIGIAIEDVYPPERFDFSSRQLRTTPVPQKYFNLHRFKIIDGVIVLSRLYKDGRHFESKALITLLVGRQASSRRQDPTPWCEFAESFGIDTVYSRSYIPYKEFTESSRAGPSYDRFISQYEEDLPAPNGPTTTSHEIRGGVMLRASVMEKEIAGIVYNLVVVEQNWVGTRGGQPDAMVLQREDPHDRDSESQALGAKRGTEPLRL